MNANGLTLIEMIITIAIIVILTMIVYPNYRQYIVKVKRERAEIELLQLASRLEQYETVNGTYQTANKTIHLIKNNDYQFQLTKITRYHYLISAIPTGKQMQDDLCQILRLNDKNQRFISGPGNLAQCWR